MEYAAKNYKIPPKLGGGRDGWGRHIEKGALRQNLLSAMSFPSYKMKVRVTNSFVGWPPSQGK